MRKKLLYFYLCIFVFFQAEAQQPLRNARKASRHSLVYKISADTAEKYVHLYKISPEQYLNTTPFTVWHNDSLQYEELPVGNYLVISVKENELVASYHCQSNLQVFPLNNQHRVQLEIKDAGGNYSQGTRVWVNKKEIGYDPVSRSYTIPSKRPDDAVLKITTPGDTLFLELIAMEKVYRSEWQQWWSNLPLTRTGAVITWPVRNVKKMIRNPPGYWFRGRNRKKYFNSGYVVLNKPEYLPKDTVKFKAYVLNKKKKQYKKPLVVSLEYRKSNQYISKNIATINPVSPGSYVYEFVAGDSLDSDQTYSLFLKTKKGTVMKRSSFRIEDYLLDEMASYTLRSEKENYYRQDTIRFYASAKDVNGLAVIDGRVNFYLVAHNINKVYKEREFIPDTLWHQEKKLAIEGETQFDIPAANFPSAHLTLEAIVIFKNSNNETEERQVKIEFDDESSFIRVKQDKDYLSASYSRNGKETETTGWLRIAEDKKPKRISFPYRAKIDPFVSEYEFEIKDSAGKVIAWENYEPGDYRLSFGRLQEKDTTGFTLHNPYKIPVHYTVLYGSKVIAKGGDSAEFVSWRDELPKKKIFNVEWNYVWAGTERKGSNTIAVLDKVLHTTITNAPVVYPGQRDTIKVAIKDYKSNPAANVNLAAVSYNSQFKEAIRVEEPPYLQRFKIRRRIVFDDYELEEAGFVKRLSLGENQQWRSKFGLDTMAYYQLLFPKQNMTILSELIHEFSPQVAVHVVKKGVPQEIYMLYLNREFVWYNGVTDRCNYAFEVQPGYTQIGVRLQDKYIQLDSIYIQPFYKHDISIDVDQLPAKALVQQRPIYFTALEKEQIESSIWQLQNDNQTNDGYVWQGNRVVFLGGGHAHRAGPFLSQDSLQFFKPSAFDFKFPFEPGYEYKLTPKMARLERKRIFPPVEKVILPTVEKTEWILGDTIIAAPPIQYPKPRQKLYLEMNDPGSASTYKNGIGSVKIDLPVDSNFVYSILYRVGVDSVTTWVKNYNVGYFHNLMPGKYNLILITSGESYLLATDLDILANGTVYLKFLKPVYEASNSYVAELIRLDRERARKEIDDYFEKERLGRSNEVLLKGISLPVGNSSITGRITDKKGKGPIPGASITVKGYNNGVSSNLDGTFKITGVQAGTYVLGFSMVGYVYREIEVVLTNAGISDLQVEMDMAASHLTEVVVTAYGITKRRELTSSMSRISGSEIISSLQGVVSGVHLSDNNNAVPLIQVRGAASVSGSSRPLYVINGVMLDQLPEGFDMDKAQVNVLSGQMATSLYGSRAADGVIVITTTDFLPGSIRDQFRDYAIWQPNLVTDKNGEVSFTVTYPDNITGWQTFIVGMDKKRRITKATTFTKSFKPLLGTLSGPQFLVEGDSSELIGKVINYTNDNFSLVTDFKLGNKTVATVNKELTGNSSAIEILNVVANTSDTIMAQYKVTTATGYSDGELRKIPVFKKGIEEAKGGFWILDKDTSFSFVPDSNAGDIILYAQNNTMDVLLDELNHLREYPYYCMEQCASKLTGLLLEKKIRRELNQPFKNEKEIQRLLEKLQKGQLFNGGWSWWENGEDNLVITNYVVQALLPLRDEVLVETTIRNGLLYLQNRLSSLEKGELLSVLFTMSEANHGMDYHPYLSKLVFDSLTVHQQWQWVRTRQNQKLGIEKELNFLLGKKRETMLGGLYWGDTGYQWDRNDMATTALAFKVLEREPGHQRLLKQMIQFFMERRDHGKWQNTVESAITLATILPTVLQQNNQFAAKPVLKVEADTTITVQKFPFVQKIYNSRKPFSVTRSGGGLVYLTAWQKIFNSMPEAVSDKFIVNSWFERSGDSVISLVAGQKAVMRVSVEVLKDAEYVQLEIPIPAGCTYASRKQDNWKVHKEYLKDRVVLFIGEMEKGKYNYNIELEPRYTGSYHLNPVKVELMYFPLNYGRNNMKRLIIEK